MPIIVIREAALEALSGVTTFLRGVLGAGEAYSFIFFMLDPPLGFGVSGTSRFFRPDTIYHHQNVSGGLSRSNCPGIFFVKIKFWTLFT